MEGDITALHGFANLISSIFLQDYLGEHPEVTVLDPPNAIEHLNNRQSMLEEVADLNLSNFYGNITHRFRRNDAVHLGFNVYNM